MAKINVDRNREVLENLVASNDTLSDAEKTSIEENNEVIKILLERLGKKKLGRKKSEKNPRKKNGGKEKGKNNEGVKRKQLPSERYPDAMVVEKEVLAEPRPACPCCGERMVDSGLREVSESLSVIPKKYIIVRELREKSRCRKCHGGMATVPAAARIVPGSSYGDDFVLDVTASKYGDLIPVERYAQMAADSGLEDLPANSLIGLTHHLANFFKPLYGKIVGEVEAAEVVYGDETPHRMLERGGGKQWYLWGFSSDKASFFAIRNTRAGAVAAMFLKGCSARALVSDAYSGYAKAIREVNLYRKEKEMEEMESVMCNTHARRKYTDLRGTPDYDELEGFRKEVEYVPKLYGKIYRLERWGCKEGFDKAKFRKGMGKYFEMIREYCKKVKEEYSPKSGMAKAAGYILNHYEGLTICVDDPGVPLDNNHEEREMRRPVVGRKTWYGTHSKRGADTTAVHFTIAQSCRLNGVNYREYMAFVVGEIHAKKDPPTPYEYARMKEEEKGPPSTGGPTGDNTS